MLLIMSQFRNKLLIDKQKGRRLAYPFRDCFKSALNGGERVSTQIPYGYKRDPDSGKQCNLLINEETAPIVKMIFELCAEGKGPKHIANYSRGRCLKPQSYTLSCSRYHKHMGEEICTPHSIREVVLDEIVLDEINKTIYYARNNKNDFVNYIKKKTSSQLTKDFNAKCSELSKSEQRVKELKTLFKRLYEDNILGRISDEQFRMLAADYTDEQKELELQIPTLRKEIEALKSECVNTQKFLDVVNKYLYIEELTPTVLRTFISKIVIHERDKKHSKTATQKIDLYFRYIGQFTVPNDYNNTYNEEYTTENAKRTA